MQIECKIKRPGGSKVDLDGVVYHFKPDAFDRHVADVASRKHASRLLAIPEGYKLPDDDEEDQAPAGTDADDAPDGEGGEGGDGSGESLNLTVNAIPVPITEDMGRDTLAHLYEQRFGKKPHHAKTAKTLADELTGVA